MYVVQIYYFIDNIGMDLFSLHQIFSKLDLRKEKKSDVMLLLKQQPLQFCCKKTKYFKL